MRNTIDPSYTTIGMLFEKNFLFEVPKYQRYYSWEDEQVDDFIKDDTDTEVGNEYGRSRSTANYWKHAALKQLRKEWLKSEHEEQEADTP